MKITFELLNESHFSFLLNWLELPHIKKWWDQDITYTIDLVREKFGKRIHGLAISNNSNNRTYAYIISLGEKK
jgi:aminoglycoside 6'-N-acetyltransferase